MHLENYTYLPDILWRGTTLSTVAFVTGHITVVIQEAIPMELL